MTPYIIATNRFFKTPFELYKVKDNGSIVVRQISSKYDIEKGVISLDFSRTDGQKVTLWPSEDGSYYYSKSNPLYCHKCDEYKFYPSEEPVAWFDAEHLRRRRAFLQGLLRLA